MFTKKDRRKICNIAWRAKKHYLKQEANTCARMLAKQKYIGMLELLQGLGFEEDFKLYQSEHMPHKN